MVEKQSKNWSTDQKKLDSNCVNVAADCSFIFDKHKENVCDCAEDEKDLDAGVVERDEVGEYIHVAWKEHKEEQNLWLSRDSFTWLGWDDLDEDSEDGCVVRNISNDSEKVHHF